MKVALYARVSTKGLQGNGREQNVDTQLLDLREFVQGARLGGRLAECSDVGWSGAKERRPGLDEAMDLARAREIDGLVVAAFDRFGRSLPHLVRSMEELQALGVAFVSVREQIDLSTPTGQLMFALIAAMSQFERAIIIERIKAGMARVKAQGSKSGKSIGRPLALFDRDQVRRLHAEGLSLRQIARQLGVDASAVRRELARRNGGAGGSGNPAPISDSLSSESPASPVS